VKGSQVLWNQTRSLTQLIAGCYITNGDSPYFIGSQQDERQYVNLNAQQVPGDCKQATPLTIADLLLHVSSHLFAWAGKLHTQAKQRVPHISNAAILCAMY